MKLGLLKSKEDKVKKTESKEIKKDVNSKTDMELSDAELDGVAGGRKKSKSYR